ncbi:hypothetical protein RJT34_05892 [Clitoria ternatea]|uniref:Fe2OG dioxygenase domain-containing protein n=1 Tax=Clitoria ternatea TaxID=43366 RepID=A0AAN9K149_CLITE
MVSRSERFCGSGVYTTKAKFCETGIVHEIVIKCGVESEGGTNKGHIETLEEFTTTVKSMMDHLLRSMARSLNLEEGSFLDQFGGQSLMMARFNFYPRCSRPDLVLGVKPHTDRSGITVLLQDKEVEGLQVLVDDKWINVPTIPEALLVNIGDQMQGCDKHRKVEDVCGNV